MNNYIKAFTIGAALLGLTACNDYLNEMPEDKLVPETYFNNVSNLQAYTLNFYTMFPSHSDAAYSLGTFVADNGTDNQAYGTASNIWVPGEWRVSEKSQNWNFEDIRKLNFFFEYAQPYFDGNNISGSPELIKQAMGEAHFFRAFAYWKYYKEVGDYPIIDGVLPNDRPALLAASERQPRNKVARYILEDLAKAAELLPEVSSYGKNGLNKDCANLFRSRVALFEATWLKYHKGTALVPGGKDWPGNSALLGDYNIDSEIEYFFDEAMKSAKLVADKFVDNLVENTDTPEGMGPGNELSVLNPYYAMFCETNLSAYDEVLLCRSYSVSAQVTTQIQAQFQKNGGGSGWTRSLVNSFVMRNGLPVYAAGSGYDEDWENQGVTATLQDRDSRIQIFTKQDNSIITYGLDKQTPGYWRMGWLLDGTYETKTTTGYTIKKGQNYDYAEAQGNLQSFTASIVFRAAEALLNYMEASVEKKGSVDETADKYWRALRRRAKIEENYMVTVNATDVQKEGAELGDWGAYSHGANVSSLLFNVRRERRNELIGEGLRMLDVRRWAALDQLMTTPYIVEGMKYWGTVYSDPESDLCCKNESGEFEAAIVSPSDGTGNMSPEENSAYVRPYQITRNGNLVWDGYLFTTAHYLSPIGHNAFVEASPNKDITKTVIYQNPGWPIEANEGAKTIDH